LRNTIEDVNIAGVDSMSAFLAWIGLALFVYSGIRMVEEWPNRNKIEKTIWFVLITVGSGFAVFALLS